MQLEKEFKSTEGVGLMPKIDLILELSLAEELG